MFRRPLNCLVAESLGTAHEFPGRNNNGVIKPICIYNRELADTPACGGSTARVEEKKSASD